MPEKAWRQLQGPATHNFRKLVSETLLKVSGKFRVSLWWQIWVSLSSSFPCFQKRDHRPMECSPLGLCFQTLSSSGGNSSGYMRVKSLQCPTLCDPVDCSSSGSSVRGILHARILEWVATPSFRGSSWPRDQTRVSYVSCTGTCVLYD